MSDGTEISWTDATWNPVSGCTKVSPACDHCYIARTPPLRMARRKFEGPNGPDATGATTGVMLHPERLDQPAKWRKPRKVFVCSLADLFHDDVPDEHLVAVFDAMANARQHTFQVLTKRPARMRSFMWKYTMGKFGHRSGAYEVGVLRNVWIGVTVENQKWADIRIPILLDTPAHTRFISAEPLLGPVDIAEWIGHEDMHFPWAYTAHGVICACGSPCRNEVCTEPRIDWVIGGGESGPGARPSHPYWFRSLRDQCSTAEIAFHFKQWGEWTSTSTESDPWWHREPDAWVSLADGQVLDEDAAVADGGSFMGVHRVGKKAAGRLLDGRTWDQFPTAVTA